jgi:hypothetical protein
MSTSAPAPVAVRSNWLAVVGFILAVVGLLGAIVFWLGFPPLCALAGAILGWFGLRRASEGAGREGLAKAALVIGVIAVVVNVLLVIIGAAGGFD